jgi:hypothetical protein
LNHSTNSSALCAMQKICDKDGISFENRTEDVQIDHLVKQTFVVSCISGQALFTLLGVFSYYWRYS